MLQHVGIEVRPGDVERTVELFELLGFERVEPPPSLAGRFTWVERSGTQIHLMHAEEPVAPPRGHLAVVVDDFDAACERLRASAFVIERGSEHWGAARAKTTGPGGNLVELMAFPPGDPGRVATLPPR